MLFKVKCLIKFFTQKKYETNICLLLFAYIFAIYDNMLCYLKHMTCDLLHVIYDLWPMNYDQPST
jgi:hypothetical protein